MGPGGEVRVDPRQENPFRAVIEQHPVLGDSILFPVGLLRKSLEVVRHHHEHFDGGGCPQGLMNDNIPLLGRIVALADAYDALTSDRAYRRALPHEMATDEIDRCAGTQFDPRVVDIFLELAAVDRLPLELTA